MPKHHYTTQLQRVNKLEDTIARLKKEQDKDLKKTYRSYLIMLEGQLKLLKEDLK